jgi:GlpG protein
MIGHLWNETHARTFGDYLYVQGIRNQIESERDGSWVVWVEGEDDVEKARVLLHGFLSRPEDAEYRQVARRASELREKEKEQDEAAARRYINGAELLRSQESYGMGPVTMTLIGLSVLVWAAMEFGGDKDFWNFLFISEYDADGILARLLYGLPEIRHGQVWRAITPIFMHAPMVPFPGFLHILFNMLWMKDLGSMVEARQSPWRLGLLVLVISAASNLAQFFVSGPNFYGMSGVVYGLLGYIWMKGRFDPASGYFIHPSIVAFMLIWFVFCLTGVMAVANTVHGVGLAIGVIWGFLGSLGRSSKSRTR